MSNKTMFDIAADKIVARMPAKDRAEMDPMTILMIISLIFSLIRIVQECNKQASDVPDMCRNMNIFQRRIYRREIRKALINKFVRFGTSTDDAVLEYARETSLEELQELFDNV